MAWSNEDAHGISYFKENQELLLVVVYSSGELHVEGISELARRVSEDLFQSGSVPVALPAHVKVFDFQLGDLVDVEFNYHRDDEGYGVLSVDAYTRSTGVRRASARWAQL